MNFLEWCDLPSDQAEKYIKERCAKSGRDLKDEIEVFVQESKANEERDTANNFMNMIKDISPNTQIIQVGEGDNLEMTLGLDGNSEMRMRTKHYSNHIKRSPNEPPIDTPKFSGFDDADLWKLFN